MTLIFLPEDDEDRDLGEICAFVNAPRPRSLALGHPGWMYMHSAADTSRFGRFFESPTLQSPVLLNLSKHLYVVEKTMRAIAEPLYVGLGTRCKLAPSGPVIPTMAIYL
ncbi:hypothetical protein HGRIS_004485 [Hohenbuehelia grisea]|uniref:Uncharacterized protein n=1 Tax=Hohenbuehelia grisea TaxID=104357 RepID=A0ABR3JC95_9AGAR